MAARILFLSLCFIAVSAYIAKVYKAEPAFTREPLSSLPMQIGKWIGRDTVIDEKVLSVLGVDDYVSREYVSSAHAMGLYAGFYKTQRQGSAIHSPMNCLPGAGWNAITRTYIRIPVASETIGPRQEIEINRITIEKGLDKAVVLYWYQAHGRVVANEYWGKIYAVVDALRINRTDGALVRVVSPILASGPQAEMTAENSAVAFVQSIFPLLSRHLPE